MAALEQPLTDPRLLRASFRKRFLAYVCRLCNTACYAGGCGTDGGQNSELILPERTEYLIIGEMTCIIFYNEPNGNASALPHFLSSAARV
ncbi:hypothetical protein FCM35_KLT11782 [Carex littledalei]|uniref:Uncharacterized protein n=1 Tax=Carex littledalei TaxID=544730 RepID=A0A833VFM4_9POAL|nr:hypothetical protein FCM35_KLT11782 [Carex littledalei]